MTYFGAFYATTDPTGTLAKVASLVPPFSSMVMPVRMAAADVPLWEIGLSTVLMLLAVAGVLSFGAKVYERAVLRTGARIKHGDVLRAK